MNISDLKDQLNGLSINGKLEKIAGLFPSRVVFTTSFGLEDQVITDIIFANGIPVTVATLDTGRLFPETYKVHSKTIDKYRKEIKVYFPDHHSVEKMVTGKGPFSFYESKKNRKECCGIRKIEPLDRALKGMECWITGIRAEQSENRKDMSDLEYDAVKGLYKFHPLFSWSQEEVEKHIRDFNVPYNILHDRGYPSIGCEPCTRAVEKGQDPRSGRWWWEDDSKRECGLHVK